jgi:hypothetical protein
MGESKFTPNSILACVLLWCSIALLYPAIYGDLLHYRVDYYIQWLGRTLNVKEESRTLYGNETNSIIGALYSHNAAWAAYTMIFFGMVMPATKVISFHTWMLTDSDSRWGKLAETCMQILGASSRWVAVDAVVEAMFVGMLLKIPSIKAEHRIAFLAFVAYCILSGASFLLVSKRKEQTQGTSALGRCSKKAPMLIMLSMVTFFMLLYVGSTGPILRVLIPESVMRESAMQEIQKAGFKDSQTFEVIKNHLISEIADKIKIDEDVSITGCVRRLVVSNVMISVWGTIALFCCVLVVPAVEVCLNTAVAFGNKSELILNGRYILKHFAMLDVLCVGMVLSVLASKCEPDIKCALLPNFLYMLGATAMWYFHSALCEAAASERVKEQPAGLLEQGQQVSV